MDSVSFLPSFLKMVFSLALVLGLLVGAMYIFRRFMQCTPAGPNDNSIINIIATRYLGPKNSIMLIEILGHIIVLGLSSNQMSSLATISDPITVDRLKSLYRQEKSNPPLSDYLRRNKIAVLLSDYFGKVSKKP